MHVVPQPIKMFTCIYTQGFIITRWLGAKGCNLAEV